MTSDPFPSKGYNARVYKINTLGCMTMSGMYRYDLRDRIIKTPFVVRSYDRSSDHRTNKFQKLATTTWLPGRRPGLPGLRSTTGHGRYVILTIVTVQNFPRYIPVRSTTRGTARVFYYPPFRPLRYVPVLLSTLAVRSYTYRGTV